MCQVATLPSISWDQSRTRELINPLFFSRKSLQMHYSIFGLQKTPPVYLGVDVTRGPLLWFFLEP